MTSEPEPGAIPFNVPSLEGNELAYVEACLRSGRTSADGPYSERVTALLRDAIGAPEVLLTTSCTAALELAAVLLAIEPGDTVIVPSFTFVSTASAFARQGAQLVFADIEPTTLGIDPQQVADLVDATTRAVAPVHYAGVACDLDGVLDAVGDRPRIDLVEDNAHGLFGRYRDRPLGSFGRFAALSFHETKNFTCGEGGALVLNEAADVERARTLVDKGTNRSAFRRGEVDQYTWVDLGASFGLADVLAAMLLGQLEARDQVLRKRAAVWHRYHDALAPHADRLGFRVPPMLPDREVPHHLFHLVMADRATRDHVIGALGEQGIVAAFHNVPLHSSPLGSKLAVRDNPCPVTDDISARLVRLPFFNDLTAPDVDRVVDAFLHCLDR